MTWDSYLRVPSAAEQYAACRGSCRATFSRQRENIRRVFVATAPSAVACLGAGVLNDIPYGTFLSAGATIHLVDWLPGSVDAGIKLSIIETDDEGRPRCLYCNPAIPNPERYCRQFQCQVDRGPAGVCGHFTPSAGEPCVCSAFERGDLPAVYYADVTAGFASCFGREIGTELGKVRSWRQAFGMARTLTGRVKRHRRALSIPEDAVQMVTSSMVVSQFEHEPYEFFSQRVADEIGPPSSGETKQLLSMMQELRTSLLVEQIELHCEEIDRILAPNGRCYLSSEMFHWHPEQKQWFMVEGLPKMLEVIGRCFAFNFDLIPETETLSRFEMRDGVSLVCSFVLESKKGARSV